MLFVVAALVTLSDQVTKQIVLGELSDGPVDLFGGLVTLRLTFNPGGAFGFLPGLPELFLVATALVIVLILVWAHRVDRRAMSAALGLVLGGGLGNLGDRVFRDTGGRVVDFIDLHFWPVFNVADACIVVGVCLVLLLGGAGEPRSSSKTEAPPR